MNSNSNHDEHSNGFRHLGGFGQWDTMRWDDSAEWTERAPGQRSPLSDGPISSSHHHTEHGTAAGPVQPPSSRHQRQPQHHQLGPLMVGSCAGASASGASQPVVHSLSSHSVPNMSPNSSRGGGHSPRENMNHSGMTGGCADRSASSRDNVFNLEPEYSFMNDIIPPMGQKAIPPQPASSSRIRAVWAGNLEEEIAKIQDLVEVYSFVAVEIRSPGILARPTLPVDSYLEYNYQSLKCNVDMSKVTQIELTFADAMGNLPKPVTTWQFNFSFNPYKDMYSQETITELRNCGVMMDWLQEEGIDSEIFGEVLTSSGLVLNDQIQWVSVIGCTQSFDRRTEFESACKNSVDTGFNGAVMSHLNPLLAYSGIYDFAFLLNLLTGKPLPDTVEGFCEEMQLYFPKVCLRRPHSSEEALTLPTPNGTNSSSNRRHPHRRIHCLRNVHDPSLFAFRALNEWFSCPDKQGWGMLKRSVAPPGA